MYLKRLNQIIDNLTNSEQIIANYIQEHMSEAKDLTSTELAQKTGTAQATVIRFSQKMGYSSFKRMVNDIDTSEADTQIDENIDYNEGVEASRQRLVSQYELSSELLMSQNKAAVFTTIARWIYKAKTILIFGYTSRKSDLAHYYTGMLCKLGLNAITDHYSSNLYARIENCQDNDVILFISESGETREILNMAKMARKKGMKVIAVTRPKKNSLSKISDIHVKLLEYGSRTFLRNLTIMHAYLFFFDLIYLEIVKLNPNKAEVLTSKNSVVTKLNYIEP